MRFQRICCALIVMLAGSAAAGDGLHIGIKLACRDYQNAWLSGQKGPLYSQCGPELAAAWRRLPDDVFRDLVRDPNTRLISVSKDKRSNYGSVSVASAQGNFNVSLSGKGFKWIITDMQTPDADRKLVSLTDILNVASVCSEFGQAFDSPKYEGFAGRTTEPLGGWLRASHQALGKEGGAFIQQLEMNRQAAQVRINGDIATLYVPVGKNDSGQYIQLTAVKSNGWLIDDVSCKTPTVEMASIRTALPMIVQANYFKSFMQNPKSKNPAEFVVAGALRNELEIMKKHPPKLPKDDVGPIRVVTFSQDGKKMVCKHDKVTFAVDFDPEQGMIREVNIVHGLLAAKLSDKLKSARKYQATARQMSKITEDWITGIFSK